jgi:glycosyltransferase involved in cell wall biosynthesis
MEGCKNIMKNNYRFPFVSIIVPTKNSATHFENCLLAIKHQTYPNIEIIVVDNHSTDDTVKIAKRFTGRIFIHGPERATQVNFGIKKAKGTYVYYTGSDLTMEPDLVRQAVSACEERKADAVYLNVLTNIKNPNIWQKVRALERKCYFKEPGMSGARFWRKNVFEKLGGFEGLLGDEIDFQTRLNNAGYRTVFINAKENNHEEYASYFVIVKRSLYYGWLTGQARVIHKVQLGAQYKFIRPEFLRHRDILLKDKYVFVFFILYKLTQYVFAGLGYSLAILMGYNSRMERYLHTLNYG